MGMVRGRRQPYEIGTVYCPVCSAVKGEPCRERRGRGLPGLRYRSKVHPSRARAAERARGAAEAGAATDGGA